MKIIASDLELILHLAQGSTTPNTLQHIAKIARKTIDSLKEQEEMQPFKDMTNASYLRGVKDGQKSYLMTNDDIELLKWAVSTINSFTAPDRPNGAWAYVYTPKLADLRNLIQRIEAAHGIKE